VKICYSPNFKMSSTIK